MPDFATTDLALAIAHHLLIFGLAAVLAFEIGAIKPPMAREDILRVARVYIWYGILAAAILAVGFSRAVFAASDSAPSVSAAVQLGSTAKNLMDSGGSIRASGTR